MLCYSPRYVFCFCLCTTFVQVSFSGIIRSLQLRRFQTAYCRDRNQQKPKKEVHLFTVPFYSNKHSVGCAPHGNRRKDAHPHLRTHPSTAEAIRTEAGKAELSRHPYKVYVQRLLRCQEMSNKCGITVGKRRCITL